jgi:hypothetical protein
MLTYRLIHALLDDDEGISTEAYDALINWLACHKDGSLQLAEQIQDVVEATDGRWYLQEGFDLSLPNPAPVETK